MKKNLLIKSMIAAFCFVSLFASKAHACSVAGTVTASKDSVCYEDTVVVITTGYTGTIFQWQSNDGTGWVNETGAGSTTDTYSVIPGGSKQFRVIVTEVSCPSDTSAPIAIVVGDIPVPTGTGAARCGYGSITLTGSGAAGGTLRWYTSPTGGVPVGTGSPFTTNVISTTTFYLEDNTYSGSSGVGQASPVLITELDFNDNPSGGIGDDIEIQNVAPYPVDVTGWQVVAGDVAADINGYNSIIQVLSGVMQPGDIISWTDVAGANYWGQNLLWNNGQASWVMILDSNNNILDLVITDWDAVSISTMAPVINGVTIPIGTQWTGAGVASGAAAASQGVVRNGNLDNNSAADFSVGVLTVTTTNPSMTLPFSGLGCSSPRVPVVATVNTSTPITLTPSSNALCLGQSATLSVSSTNGAYAYTWFPSTGLNTTTGNSVIATPLVPTTYYVSAVDGACGAIDSVFISVGPTSVAGSATISADTVCSGTNTTLTLTGSTGNIQWQSNSGSGWVNETGPGSTAAIYQFNPTVSAAYWAVVTSGGCPTDTSNLFNVGVITVVDPVTTNDTVCAGNIANLQASGNGNISWFTAASGGTLVHTGASYNVAISSTTTFYVQSNDGGSPVHLGPPNKSFGNQTQSSPNSFGLTFDVAQDATIDSVSVYPVTSGQLIFSLLDPSGIILNTKTVTVPASPAALFPVALGFSVPPGLGYRLVLDPGSITCGNNGSGAIYPYTNPSCPVSIVGYCNPNPQVGTLYYYMYNWVVTDGCKSGMIPVTAVVVGPAQPIISGISGTLTSSSAPNYQWLLNGTIIPGATSQSYVTTQPGSYQVQYVDVASGCTVISDPYIILSVFEATIADDGVKLYPNPSSDRFYLNFDKSFKGDAVIKIYNNIGQLVMEQHQTNPAGNDVAVSKQLAKGTYQLELTTQRGIYHSKLVKQ